jgi:hypothetical protein
VEGCAGKKSKKNNMKKVSKFLRLDFNDFSKGLLLAVLGAIYGLIQPFFEAGIYHFDWPLIWKTALKTAALYLLKNLLTNSKGHFAAPE